MLSKSLQLEKTATFEKLLKFLKSIELGPLSSIAKSAKVELNTIINKPLTIAVMGEFNAGKSSFVNALLGKTDFLPVSILPKTAAVTVLVHGDEESVRVFKGQASVQYPGYSFLGKVHKASTMTGDAAVAKELASIDYIEVACDNEYLRQFRIVDTPGFNHDELMTQKASSILIDGVKGAGSPDLVIWLFNPGQAATASECARIKMIRQTGRQVYGILNHVDQVEPRHLKSIVVHIQDELKGVLCNNNIHCICAKASMLSSNSELRETFMGLRHDLETTIFNEDFHFSLERMNILANQLDQKAVLYCNKLAQASKQAEISFNKIAKHFNECVPEDENHRAQVNSISNEIVKGLIIALANDVLDDIRGNGISSKFDLQGCSAVVNVGGGLKCLRILEQTLNDYIIANKGFRWHFEEELCGFIKGDWVVFLLNYLSQEKQQLFKECIVKSRRSLSSRWENLPQSGPVGLVSGYLMNGFYSAALKKAKQIYDSNSPGIMTKLFSKPYDEAEWEKEVQSSLWCLLDADILIESFSSYLSVDKIVDDLRQHIFEVLLPEVALQIKRLKSSLALVR